MNQWYNSGGP